MPTTLIPLPKIQETIANSIQHQQYKFIQSINSYKQKLMDIQQAIHATSVIANQRMNTKNSLTTAAMEKSQDALRLILVSLESQQSSIISIITSMERINGILEDAVKTDLINDSTKQADTPLPFPINRMEKLSA